MTDTLRPAGLAEAQMEPAMAGPANGAQHLESLNATITADDPRYSSLVRGTNHRFLSTPDAVKVVTSTDQVVAAVGEAVASGQRLTVRSGGHCFESFTSSESGVLIDLSEMTRVYFDEQRRAFAMEPGATLGHVYRTLFKGWNVTIPAGECTEVGVGGHFAGGGYGTLSRSRGAVVDYLCAVEVVVIDQDGRASAVVATDAPDDPHQDLWWAHTGGGGGNFGVVTRYWVRSPGATSTRPEELLPTAPGQWRSGMVAWPWESMSEQDFTILLRNFGTWFEQHSGANSPYAKLSGFFLGSHRPGYGLAIGAMADEAVPDAQALMDVFFDTVTEGMSVQGYRAQLLRPWLYFSAYPNWGDPGTPEARRIKIKAAYLRKGYRDSQIATIHRHLTSDVQTGGQLILIGYGGQVNTVEPSATATAQRDSILKAAFMTVWAEESADETELDWLRSFYRDVYVETGGVPTPDEYSDGSYINYPDVDLADPAWNTSGVAWSSLYYKDNYPRLQQIKQRYDPRNEFHHALSIELPG